MSATVVRYRYRAYPTVPQHIALAKVFGCARVVFNDAIAARRDAHDAGKPRPTAKQLSKTLITQARTTHGRKWLAEVSSVPLQQALADAETAYRNFFASRRGDRKGRKMGAPKFRSRRDTRQSARFTTNARFHVLHADVAARTAVLRLPNVGDLALVYSRELPHRPTSVTVIREADGRVYASFVVATYDWPADPTGRVCGIDPGLSTFATVLTRPTAGGPETVEQVDNQRYLRRKARALARSQRSLARKQKGSANRAKAKTKVAVLHRKVRETRLDHAHQTAARIVAAHDIIAIEDLHVAGLAQGGEPGAEGSGRRKSVHDTGLGQFLRLVTEKSIRQGKTVITVGRYYPSTQICSACHHKTGPKGEDELNIRTWNWINCGVTHDRDPNAARNILTEGLRLLAISEHPTYVAGGQPET